MNHADARAMLARAQDGQLVTIRLPDGSTATGRAYRLPDGLWMRDATRFIRVVTTENVVKVTS